YCAQNGSCRLDITKRPGTPRAAHLHAWFAAPWHDTGIADPAALRRAVGKGTHVSSALSHRRRMVRADWYPGHLHSVFSRARSAAGAGEDNDARSRRRNAGVVHEIDAARGGARLQLRLSASTKEKMAADFWTNVRRR